MEDMMAMMAEMNKKMDIIMEKMGCSMSKDEYMGMSEDEKDTKDEEDMKKGM